MHWACEQSTLEVVKMFVKHGVSPEESDPRGRVPMHYACHEDIDDIVQYLLDLGVARDFPGADIQPFHATIWDNAHRCAKLLLEAGCHYEWKNSFGYSALHIAAQVADVRMLQLLSEHDLEKLDTDAKGSDGLTPREIYDRRIGKTEELTNAFEALLLSVSRAGADISRASCDVEGGCDEAEESELFYDAKDILTGDEVKQINNTK